MSAPTTVPGLPASAAVAASQYHRLVVGTDGAVHSWGEFAGAHLGRGGSASLPAPVDAALPALVDADAGFFSSFVLAQDGTLFSFGTADGGALGDSYGRTLSPVRLTPPAGTTQISAGQHHVLARTAGGAVLGWGYNEQGQLGVGPREIAADPRTIPVPATVSRVVAGWRSSYALDDTGDVWAWGGNNYGQLGDGTRQSRPTPQLIDLPTPITDLDAGAQSGIALDTSGQVWTWGGNSSGEVGTGDGDERLTPFAVPLAEAVTDVAMGEEHAAALDATGTVWAWGWNNRGQVGGTPNQPNQQQSPRIVPGLPADIVALVAGDAQTLALDADGSVWEWGRVLPGGAGTGTPVEVTGIPPMSQVSANGNVRIGRSTTGEVWVWGDNVEGDLATGDTGSQTGPRRLGLSGATWVEVSRNYRNNTLFVLASPAGTTTATLAAGGTVRTGLSASTADPANLAVTSPVAGHVSITEDPTLVVPGGLTVLGMPFDVEAPVATVEDPLVLTFSLHRSAIPAGTALTAITPLRDGVLVADCAAGSGSSAVPDPCVASRSRDPLGTVEVVVRTSHASTWALVEHTGPPPMPPLVSVDGISDGDVLLLNEETPVTVTCEERGIPVRACEAPARADTTTVGPHVLVASATDRTGAVTSVEIGYQVRYAFSGFDGAAAAPTVNTGKAGRTYPLSWVLRDAAGRSQSEPSAVEAIKVRPVSCGQFDLATGDPLDATTAGSSGLRVQPDGSFAYNWKTPRTAGCHRLEVHLADGTKPWLAFSMR